MIERIHHLNLLVRNLPQAIEQWRSLGLGPFIEEALPERGVATARVRLGPTWLVLVQPLDPESAPGRHLQRHGEGVFLLSLGCDSAQRTTDALTQRGLGVGPRRKGLSDWWVFDIETFDAGSLVVQFCEDPVDG